MMTLCAQPLLFCLTRRQNVDTNRETYQPMPIFEKRQKLTTSNISHLFVYFFFDPHICMFKQHNTFFIYSFFWCTNCTQMCKQLQV